MQRDRFFLEIEELKNLFQEIVWFLLTWQYLKDSSKDDVFIICYLFRTEKFWKQKVTI